MSKAQILIVEDEGLIAKDLQATLRRLGYDVPVTVGTGEMAIQTAQANRPDLILMDIQLRGKMDGVQAAEAISAQQEVPIVYLTANSDEPTFQRAKITDPFGFMIKPFDERSLQAGIEMALYKHKMEKHNREREEWLSTTLRSIADGIITTDENGRITFANDVAEQITGWPASEAKGMHYEAVFSLVDESGLKVTADSILSVLSGKRSSSRANQSILGTKSGHRVQIEHSTARIRYGADRVAGCVIVFRDVSDHLRMENELRQSQKMDVIGKLAGSIAHDFNNAITAVMGYSSIMVKRLPQGDPMREDALHILHAAEHSARLTRQLLAFSRKQMLDPVRLNLGEAVQEMRGIMKRLIREDIALSVCVADGLWSIEADPGHIEQLVLNMAINARDAIDGNGSVSIRVCNATLDAEAAAKIHRMREGEFVLFEISDTGIGMSPEIIERIFEPFFTTKGPEKGTGLGLSTCESIVKGAGGFINVKSAPGEGTTFSVYFPRSETGRIPNSEKAELATSASHEAGGTILIVEDEEAVRMIAARVLTDAGYSVLEAENGVQALALLKEREAPVDLVITDMVMPLMSGREFLEQLRASSYATRTLVISGYTDDETTRDAVFNSQLQFLHKPFTPAALLCKVASLLES